MKAKESAGRPARPGKRELEARLGRAAGHWTWLCDGLVEDFGTLAEEWIYNPRSQHWVLRLRHEKKKRTVVYLIPLAGRFEAAFALGEKACRAARDASLDAAVLEVIEKARRYAEGRDVRLQVRSAKAAANVRRLAAIKMAN